MLRAFAPYPATVEQSDAEQLDISVKIQTPTGWLDLEDPDSGYEVHAESLGERSVTYRKTEASSPWVEGTFPISAVRDNVVESLSIYVRGDTTYEFKRRVQVLTDAIEQLSYLLLVRIEDASEYWQCFPADYSIQTQHEYLHARLGVVRAQVPRLPAVTLAPATGDET